MTTTEPITAAWIEALVPAVRRQEGLALLAELAKYSESLQPLLQRIGAFLNQSENAKLEAENQVAELAGSETAHEVSDDLLGLMSTLDHSLDLNAAVANMGIDPDGLPGVEV